MSDFTIMDRHVEEPRPHIWRGRVILSRIAGGRSRLTAPVPSLKIVLEGEANYTVDGRTVRVRPGQFLYVDEGGCELSSRSELLGLCVLLPQHETKLLPASAEGPRGAGTVFGRALVLSTLGSGIGRTLDEFSRMIIRDPSAGHQLARTLIYKMNEGIADALGETQAAMASLNVAKRSTRVTLFERLEHARAHLHMNDDRAVSLPELAALSGLSRFHLARFFKLAFGRAPIAYHRVLRLERAGTLLAEGHKPLAEVATLTGYSDEVALSHAFRRHFGCPPQFWAVQRRGAGDISAAA